MEWIDKIVIMALIFWMLAQAFISTHNESSVTTKTEVIVLSFWFVSVVTFFVSILIKIWL